MSTNLQRMAKRRRLLDDHKEALELEERAKNIGPIALPLPPPISTQLQPEEEEEAEEHHTTMKKRQGKEKEGSGNLKAMMTRNYRQLPQKRT